jgi:hypothetical protein
VGKQARQRRLRKAAAKERPSPKPTVAKLAPPSVTVPIGPSGLPEFTTFVGSNGDGPLHDPRGGPGTYSAVVTLSRPGIRPLPEYAMVPSTHLRGDSHIAMARPAYEPPGLPSVDEIRMETATEVVYSGKPNDKGFLSGFAVYPFEAKSFQDAYVGAYQRVAPTLSAWSAHLDVPLNVFQVDVLELASGNSMIGYVNPFPEIPLAVEPGLHSDKDLGALTSVYREALNSSSLLYQYLCFFKIAEALNDRRLSREKKAARGGPAYSAPTEKVPAHEGEFEMWLGAIFPVKAPEAEPFRAMYLETYLPRESWGRSFRDLLGGVLVEIRNQIGHALWSPARGVSGELIDLDDRTFHAKVHHWLPLLKAIARRMLKNDFPGRFLAHLPDAVGETSAAPVASSGHEDG